MNYKLELHTQVPGSNIVFNNIILDSFKVNIVERYSGKMNFNPKLCEVLFKVRTLDNILIKNKSGNVSLKVKGNEFLSYQEKLNALFPYKFRNRPSQNKETNEDYVHFILCLIVANYELN